LSRSGGGGYSGPAVTLAFPLKDGTYYIAQGGGTTLVNAHHPYGAQIYALDIVRINSSGARAEGLSQTFLEQFAIYGTLIYSPCDGNISTAVDGLEDIAPGASGDTEHAAGNHVFINCQNGVIQVLLAHMKKNSLVVRQGALVKVGDPIGQVGNSGNTTEPHLHIHASKGGTPDRLISGVGLPILFNENFLVRNDIVNE
jgi:murein DD-endopeptidase MepM/ murein hydrolase activator NlpD